METKLTSKVKEYAFSLGADLVGVANIERYENAPIKMSPQGILPTAKSVIVCAIHHPDAAIELDGEVHSQIMGPYRVQYIMNSKLDFLSFKIGRMLEDMRHKAVPIASSNIWRYRGYKDLDAVFAPDISHIYSAVAAGLGELGWNGLCMTPEYGTRNRFVSIITDAELDPNPLYDGEKLCDMCGRCIEHCPTNAYRAEVNGVKDVVIEGKHHRFANKNLWRCAWGEHFDIDLDLPIPDKVNEQVLLDRRQKHGSRGGEMGVCLKVCLPKHLRKPDPGYCKIADRRNRHSIASDLPMDRSNYDHILRISRTWDVDSVHFISPETLTENNIDITNDLPDGQSIILVTERYSLPLNGSEEEYKEKFPEIWHSYQRITSFNTGFAELDICRFFEKQGYSTLPKTYMDHEPIRELCGIKNEGNTLVYTAMILTAAPVKDKAYTNLNKSSKPKDLKQEIINVALEKGGDMAGVASAETIDSIAEQLRDIRIDEKIISATDKNAPFNPYDPLIEIKKRAIRNTTDYIDDAKSVIIVGVHYPETPVERLGQPPAEAVGPYVFVQYETNWQLGHVGYSVCQALENQGHKAVYTYDLTGAGSVVGSPRGQFADATCNTLEAVAAGLGTLALNGSVNTEEFGIHQRFIAIVTDAELEADDVLEGNPKLCGDCGKCIKACPTLALRADDMVDLDMDGVKIPYLPVDRNRCDWASKYALTGEDGNKFGGSTTDIPCPDEVTAENLADALKQQDNVYKFRPVTGESCIVSCPLSGTRNNRL
ncbi:MAG: 4Fe-4S binding protein [Clostridia bacterium]|nr:4Fe-4S binding protein [Clostridia bacterium]